MLIDFVQAFVHVTIFCCRLVKSMWTSFIRLIYVYLKYYMHVLFLKVFITLYECA